jgi:hypothetical protein
MLCTGTCAGSIRNAASRTRYNAVSKSVRSMHRHIDWSGWLVVRSVVGCRVMSCHVCRGEERGYHSSEHVIDIDYYLSAVSLMDRDLVNTIPDSTILAKRHYGSLSWMNG